MPNTTNEKSPGPWVGDLVYHNGSTYRVQSTDLPEEDGVRWVILDGETNFKMRVDHFLLSSQWFGTGKKRRPLWVTTGSRLPLLGEKICDMTADHTSRLGVISVIDTDIFKGPEDHVPQLDVGYVIDDNTHFVPVDCVGWDSVNRYWVYDGGYKY